MNPRATSQILQASVCVLSVSAMFSPDSLGLIGEAESEETTRLLEQHL